MTFGKAGKFNVLQTSRIIHNLSNDFFISNNIINNMVIYTLKHPINKSLLIEKLSASVVKKILVLIISDIILILTPKNIQIIINRLFQQKILAINILIVTISQLLLYNQLLLVFSSKFTSRLITKSFRRPSQLMFQWIILYLSL